MNHYPYGLLQTNAPAPSWMAQIPTQPVALSAPSYTDEAAADAIFETFIDYDIYSPADLPRAVTEQQPTEEGHSTEELPHAEVKAEPLAECLRGSSAPAQSLSPRTVASLLSSPGGSSAASTSAPTTPPTTPDPEERPAATGALKNSAPDVVGLFDFGDAAAEPGYAYDALGEHWPDFVDAPYRLAADFPDYPSAYIAPAYISPAYAAPAYIPPAYTLPTPSPAVPSGSVFRSPSPSPSPASPLSPLPPSRAASPAPTAARTPKAARAARAGKPYAKDLAARRKGRAKAERASPDVAHMLADAALESAVASASATASTSTVRPPSPASSRSSLSPPPPPAPAKTRAKTSGVTRTAKAARAHASTPYEKKAPASRKPRPPPPAPAPEASTDALTPTGRPSRAAARQGREKVAACLASESTPDPSSSSARARRRPDDEEYDHSSSYSEYSTAPGAGGGDRPSREAKRSRCAWPGCGRGFTRRSDCARHYAVHTRADAKPCPCPFAGACAGRFSRTDAARRHVHDSCDVAEALRAEGAGEDAGVDWEEYARVYGPW
ncbi:hypothetical protein PsYK624_144820 [Phanerochaete sordida]|uniref:C2H2-type domain-containing protein n=1 Tax=Phanerochaete sordida TaxID=48140 RepID=A0A9P3GNI8_9APHY|nr:hypothetical protein PsYK624_144820 [Phanerochaete sordida]